MSHMYRSLRYATATALVVSSLLLMSSPAGAATGSMTADSNGLTVTVTSGNTANDYAVLLLFAAPHTCTSSTNPTGAIAFTSSSAAQYGLIPLNAPTSITFGSVGSAGPPSFASTSVGAGSYEACLVDASQPSSLLQSLSVTIVDPNATTTTTSTTVPGPATTTTSAGGGTVAPTFAG
jgi:hypothetical protein